ncbi:MAG: hypothetical protein ABF750_09320 [Oenococcus oeni]
MNKKEQKFSKVTINSESVLIDGHEIKGLDSYKINSFEKMVHSHWPDKDGKEFKTPNIVRLDISVLVNDLEINN